MSKLSPGRYSATSSWSTRLGKTGKPHGISVADSRNPVVVLQDGSRVTFVPSNVSVQELLGTAAVVHQGGLVPMKLHVETPERKEGSPSENTDVLWFNSLWGPIKVEHPGAALLGQHEQLLVMCQGGFSAALKLQPFLTPELSAAFVKTQQKTVSEALTQQLIDRTDTSRLDERREAMRAAAVKAILQNSEWLTATQLSDIINPALKNKHAKASSFLKDKRVFALLKDGEYIYPRYQFDATGQPIPVVEQVLKVFDGYTSFRIAAWFESTSSALNGKRPREVLELMSNEVLAAAVEHARGPMHG